MRERERERERDRQTDRQTDRELYKLQSCSITQLTCITCSGRRVSTAAGHVYICKLKCGVAVSHSW